MNYNLGQKKFQNPKFIFYFIMRHPGVCIFEKTKLWLRFKSDAK